MTLLLYKCNINYTLLKPIISSSSSLLYASSYCEFTRAPDKREHLMIFISHLTTCCGHSSVDTREFAEPSRFSYLYIRNKQSSQ